MDRWLTRLARIAGTLVGGAIGVVAVQYLRLQRRQFLPGHPGFYVNHVVQPSTGAADAQRLRMVVLGDSTVAGVGVERPEDSLPHMIAQRIADAERRPVHVVSYGWAGARATDVARHQLPRALEPLRKTESDPFLPGAEIVAVVIGSNDATHQTRPSRYRASLRSALAGIRTAAPEARVVLAGIPDFRGALRDIEPLIFIAHQYGRLLRPVSRDEADRVGAAYADLAAEVPSRIRGRTDVLSSDQFHPSAAGYAAWADVIAEALLKLPRPTAAVRGTITA